MKHNNRKLVEVTCNSCGKNFHKNEAEFNRSQRLGRRHFCSRSCSGKGCINNIPPDKRTWEHLKGLVLIDEFSPFREHLRRARNRDKELNISLNDLREVWESQKGICPYSGAILDLKSKDFKVKASLDRIDSSKGYVKGNVQFVLTPVNLMKGTMTHEQTIEFCKIIANHWQK